MRILEGAGLNSLTERQFSDILGLRQKLAADGVALSSYDAVEKGIFINEDDRDLTYELSKRSYPTPRDMLMHNPFFVAKKGKKKKKRRAGTKSRSPSPKKKKK